MCYAARFPGKPGYGMITVDRPEYAKDNANNITDPSLSPHTS